MSTIPEYKIAFKTESLLMKVLGKILFFNKSFMNNYTTTLGRTIYFTNRNYVKSHPVTTRVTLVHELVHVKDYEKYGPILFTLMYGAPQILAPLALVLLFVAPWWIALAWAALCLAPIPAYFRMRLEQKAYTFSLYCLHKINMQGYKIDFDRQIANYVDNFTTSDYYYMWPLFNDKHFKEALSEIQAGRKPFYEAEYYEMADKVLELDVKF